MTQLTDKGYWAVEVPDDACRFQIRYGRLYGLKHPGFSTRSILAELPPGSWQYLFTTKGATEEQATTIVDKRNELRCGIYKGYEPTKLTACWNAKQSLESLLRSKGCDVNKNYAILKLNDNG